MIYFLIPCMVHLGCPRPSRAQLRAAARGAWADAGLAQREGARLVREMLWAEAPPWTEEGGEARGADEGGVAAPVLSERVPPRSRSRAAGPTARSSRPRRPWPMRRARAASSACPKWMRCEE